MESLSFGSYQMSSNFNKKKSNSLYLLANNNRVSPQSAWQLNPSHSPNMSPKHFTPICINQAAPCPSRLPTSVCLLPKAPRKRRHPSDLDLKFPCPFYDCGRKYALENSLRQHLRKHHCVHGPLPGFHNSGNNHSLSEQASPSRSEGASPNAMTQSPSMGHGNDFSTNQTCSVQSVPHRMHKFGANDSSTLIESPEYAAVLLTPTSDGSFSPENHSRRQAGYFAFKGKSRQSYFTASAYPIEVASEMYSPGNGATTTPPCSSIELKREVGVDFNNLVDSLVAGRTVKPHELKCTVDMLAIGEIEQELLQLLGSNDPCATATATC